MQGKKGTLRGCFWVVRFPKTNQCPLAQPVPHTYIVAFKCITYLSTYIVTTSIPYINGAFTLVVKSVLNENLGNILGGMQC
jgi:hypothetical protein